MAKVNSGQYRAKIAELQSELANQAKLVDEAIGRRDELKTKCLELDKEIIFKSLEVRALNQMIIDLEKRKDLVVTQIKAGEKKKNEQVDGLNTTTSIKTFRIKDLEDKNNSLCRQIVEMELELERFEKTKEDHKKIVELDEQLKKDIEIKYTQADKYLTEAKEIKNSAEKLLSEAGAKEKAINQFKESVFFYARRTNQFYAEKGMKEPLDLSKLN